MQDLAEFAQDYSKLAEHNGTFIETALKAIFDDGIQRIDVDTWGFPEVKTYLKGNKGLYVFFVHVGLSYYPVYVGYTGNNFYDRFRQHGVIDKARNLEINNGENFLQINNGENFLYVSVFPCDAGAKTLETLFLKAFDFALNKEENADERETLELSQPVNLAYKSKLIFQQTWMDMRKSVFGMIDKIQKIEETVQFK